MDYLSRRIADFWIKKHEIETEQYEIYRYGTQMALEMGCAMIASIMIMIYFHMFIEGILFFCVFMPLRSYFGGIHMKTFRSCFVCSCVTFALILWVVRNVNASLLVSYTMLLVSLICILLIASKGQSEEDKYFCHKLFLIVGVIAGVSLFLGAFKRGRLVFLMACTCILVVVSKVAERVLCKRERTNGKNS